MTPTVKKEMTDETVDHVDAKDINEESADATRNETNTNKSGNEAENVDEEFPVAFGEKTTTNKKKKRKGDMEEQNEDASDDETPKTAKKAKNEKERKGVKEEQHEDSSDDLALKKPDEKPRVNPECAQEVADKIVAELAKNFAMGIQEMHIDTLAASVGYKNPRSDTILAAFKIFKENGKATMVKDMVRLSEKGIEEHVEEEAPPPNAEAAMELYWNQLELQLKSRSKTKSSKANENARNIWELLSGWARSFQERSLGSDKLRHGTQHWFP